ncbi:cupin domain-containing protein [Amycolatopsis sp. NPDC059657]|uniref:cupin domain-containing protein n=1 Tax=Amycolatopsis sp. NPDC059657 TaxID=3346899 RepID=UPI0036714711
MSDVEANRRRGGDLRVLLGPATVGSTSGFLGVVRLSPGEVVTEHYHPYSEEFLLVTEGTLLVTVEDTPITAGPYESVFVAKGSRHRLENIGNTVATAVFQLGPLAPKPELGHVDTEELPAPDEPVAILGGGR